MRKTALIVDDSRSARVVLKRMLETYDLQVDTCESAEAALDYLNHHRPDVIFMDHLMPGMDGFEAVTAIKKNPDTAMIPIMMYTSQEGEVYRRQSNRWRCRRCWRHCTWRTKAPRCSRSASRFQRPSR